MKFVVDEQFYKKANKKLGFLDSTNDYYEEENE